MSRSVKSPISPSLSKGSLAKDPFVIQKSWFPLNIVRVHSTLLGLFTGRSEAENVRSWDMHYFNSPFLAHRSSR